MANTYEETRAAFMEAHPELTEEMVDAIDGLLIMFEHAAAEEGRSELNDAEYEAIASMMQMMFGDPPEPPAVLIDLSDPGGS